MRDIWLARDLFWMTLSARYPKERESLLDRMKHHAVLAITGMERAAQLTEEEMVMEAWSSE